MFLNILKELSRKLREKEAEKVELERVGSILYVRGLSEKELRLAKKASDEQLEGEFGNASKRFEKVVWRKVEKEMKRQGFPKSLVETFHEASFWVEDDTLVFDYGW